jgi:hypothetical protein
MSLPQARGQDGRDRPLASQPDGGPGLLTEALIALVVLAIGYIVFDAPLS